MLFARDHEALACRKHGPPFSLSLIRRKKSITLTQNSELPRLSSEQIDFLRRFVLWDARTGDIRNVLEGIFDFDFSGQTRTASVGFRVPEPGVIVTRDHIRNAVEKRKRGDISEQELIYWATMLLLTMRSN